MRGGSTTDIQPFNAAFDTNLRLPAAVDERPSPCPPGLPARRASFPVDLAPYTTLRLGGPARAVVEARTEAELIRAASDPAVVLLAGGSNVVVADDGLDATVARVLTRGVEVEEEAAHVLLRVAAGEPWDDLVARCVAGGLVGIECLAGNPGLDGRDADPERRRLRPGGRRHARRRARARPPHGGVRRGAGARRSAASRTARARSRASAAIGGARGRARLARAAPERAGPLRRARPRAGRRGRCAVRRSGRRARPCSRCAVARAWSSIPATTTRGQRRLVLHEPVRRAARSPRSPEAARLPSRSPTAR